MSGDELAARLSSVGVDVPSLDPLPSGAGVRAAGFASQGDEALGWWHRLRAVHPATGLWPVLISNPGDLASVGGTADTDTAERMAQAASLDGAKLLDPRDYTEEELYNIWSDVLLDRWPDEPCDPGWYRLPYLRGCGASIHVALIEAEHGWQVPVLLGYGDWNDCPSPAVHGAVLRYWHERWGIDLTCMSDSGLEVTVARPPRTRQDAFALAGEYAEYCADGVDLYDAEDVFDLAPCLLNAEVVRFWWD